MLFYAVTYAVVVYLIFEHHLEILNEEVGRNTLIFNYIIYFLKMFMIGYPLTLAEKEGFKISRICDVCYKCFIEICKIGCFFLF